MGCSDVVCECNACMNCRGVGAGAELVGGDRRVPTLSAIITILFQTPGTIILDPRKRPFPWVHRNTYMQSCCVLSSYRRPGVKPIFGVWSLSRLYYLPVAVKRKGKQKTDPNWRERERGVGKPPCAPMSNCNIIQSYSTSPL
jgi:hypothetical protein